MSQNPRKKHEPAHRDGEGQLPEVDIADVGVISATEMTGIAPVAVPEDGIPDVFNQLWPNPTAMLGATPPVDKREADPSEEE